MRQLVALSLMQQQSASERLRGVSWAYQAEPSDREVLGALVTAVNHDTNVNVRLAAVDALRRFAASPETRRAVVEALPSQTTPLVQVALIDLLVDFKERNAAGVLKSWRRMETRTTESGNKPNGHWRNCNEETTDFERHCHFDGARGAAARPAEGDGAVQ